MGKKGKKNGKGGKVKKGKKEKKTFNRDDELNAAVTNALLWKQKLELTERQVTTSSDSLNVITANGCTFLCLSKVIQ